LLPPLPVKVSLPTPAVKESFPEPPMTLAMLATPPVFVAVPLVRLTAMPVVYWE
jgi:hypothetical protein